PLLMQPARKCQSAVAAESNQSVELQKLEGAQRGAREIESATVIGLSDFSAQMRRHILRFGNGRIDPRSVEHCSAAAIDGPGVRAAERHDPRGIVRSGFRNDVQERGPAAAKTDDLVTFVLQSSDEGLDRGVQSGDVATDGA